MLSSRPTAVGIPARLTMALLIVLLVSTRAATAHPLTFTDATIVLRPGGTFQADLIVDLDALALGAPQDADDAGLVAALRALSPDELDDRVDCASCFSAECVSDSMASRRRSRSPSPTGAPRPQPNRRYRPYSG